MYIFTLSPSFSLQCLSAIYSMCVAQACEAGRQLVGAGSPSPPTLWVPGAEHTLRADSEHLHLLGILLA